MISQTLACFINHIGITSVKDDFNNDGYYAILVIRCAFFEVIRYSYSTFKVIGMENEKWDFSIHRNPSHNA